MLRMRSESGTCATKRTVRCEHGQVIQTSEVPSGERKPDVSAILPIRDLSDRALKSLAEKRSDGDQHHDAQLSKSPANRVCHAISFAISHRDFAGRTSTSVKRSDRGRCPASPMPEAFPAVSSFAFPCQPHPRPQRCGYLHARLRAHAQESAWAVDWSACCERVEGALYRTIQHRREMSCR